MSSKGNSLAQLIKLVLLTRSKLNLVGLVSQRVVAMPLRLCSLVDIQVVDIESTFAPSVILVIHVNIHIVCCMVVLVMHHTHVHDDFLLVAHIVCKEESWT
jgi:hypothetical protein